MCEHCGCTPDNEESRHRRTHEQGIPHEHEHRLTVEQNILSLNNSRAEENRSYFARRGICAVNMVSFSRSGEDVIAGTDPAFTFEGYTRRCDRRRPTYR